MYITFQAFLFCASVYVGWLFILNEALEVAVLLIFLFYHSSISFYYLNGVIVTYINTVIIIIININDIVKHQYSDNRYTFHLSCITMTNYFEFGIQLHCICLPYNANVVRFG